MMNSQMPMTHQQQYKYLTQAKYQYGMDNDIEMAQRRYNREAQLNRHSYANSVAGVGGNWGGYGVAAAAGTMAGLTGVSAFAMPMLAPIIPMHFINKGMELNMERQRYMQSAALDLETYRDRIGLSTLTYNQATQLGSRLTQNAYRPGQFFNAQQQSEIHKIAISNDMISSKVAGMSKGDLQQYEKNFKDLLDTVQTVVKTLKTTKEGGLSVIKEMQMQGFGTMGQIRNNLISASAYGGLTGIGTTNMLNIGAAGAAAVQGTPWTSAAGASMFQAGAAQAGYLSQSGNIGAQRAVAMAGGVAQAGASLATSQMNALTSGSGLKLMAYMMDKGGVINLERQKRLMGGQVSAYEITSAAAHRGMEYGAGGRATFRRDVEKAASDMAEEDPIKLAMTTKAYFNAWKAHKGGTIEDQAYVFARSNAGQYGSRAVAVMEQSLLQPAAYGAMYATRAAAQFAESAITNPPSELQKFAWRAYGTIGSPAVQLGMNISNSIQETTDIISKTTDYAKRGLGYLAGSAFEALAGGGSGAQKYGVFNTGRGVGDYKKNFLRAYGMGTDITTERVKTAAQFASEDLKNNRASYDKNVYNNWDAGDALSKMSRKDIQYVTQTLQSGLMGGTTREIYKDPQMRRLLNLDRGGDMFKNVQNNSDAASLAFLSRINGQIKSNTAKTSSEMTDWDNFAKQSGNVGLANQVMVNMRQGEEKRVNMWANEDISTYSNDANPRNAERRAMILASKKILAEREYKKLAGLGDVSTLGAAEVQTRERELNLENQKAFGYAGRDYNERARQRLAKKGTIAWVGSRLEAGWDVAIAPLADKNQRYIMQERYKKVFGGADIMTPEGALDVMKQLETKSFTPNQLKSVNLGTDAERAAFIDKRAETEKRAAMAQRLKDQKTVTGALSRMELSKDYKGQTKNLLDWYAGNAKMTEETIGAVSAFYGMDIKDVRSAVKSGDKGIIAVAALNSQDVVNADNRKRLLTEQIDALKKMKYGDKILIQDGDKKRNVGWKERDVELDKRNIELAELNAKATAPVDVGPAKRGLNAYVNPPVLNYWNNQWIL
jgi:hypothetical protein